MFALAQPPRQRPEKKCLVPLKSDAVFSSSNSKPIVHPTSMVSVPFENKTILSVLQEQSSSVCTSLSKTDSSSRYKSHSHVQKLAHSFKKSSTSHHHHHHQDKSVTDPNKHGKKLENELKPDTTPIVRDFTIDDGRLNVSKIQIQDTTCDQQNPSDQEGQERQENKKEKPPREVTIIQKQNMTCVKEYLVRHANDVMYHIYKLNVENKSYAFIEVNFTDLMHRFENDNLIQVRGFAYQEQYDDYFASAYSPKAAFHYIITDKTSGRIFCAYINKKYIKPIAVTSVVTPTPTPDPTTITVPSPVSTAPETIQTIETISTGYICAYCKARHEGTDNIAKMVLCLCKRNRYCNTTCMVADSPKHMSKVHDCVSFQDKDLVVRNCYDYAIVHDYGMNTRTLFLHLYQDYVPGSRPRPTLSMENLQISSPLISVGSQHLQQQPSPVGTFKNIRQDKENEMKNENRVIRTIFSLVVEGCSIIDDSIIGDFINEYVIKTPIYTQCKDWRVGKLKNGNQFLFGSGQAWFVTRNVYNNTNICNSLKDYLIRTGMARET